MVIIRQLKKQSWYLTYKNMNLFTNQRNSKTKDEIWLVEHQPVFTQGRSANEDEVLYYSSNIPIEQSNRGGKTTYHGPGQQIMYVLIDLKRREIGVRNLVNLLENAVIYTLSYWNIQGTRFHNNPGIYVNKRKICSIGLRIINGYSLHGLSLNVKMDLVPFSFIKPCGFSNLKVTQISYFVPDIKIDKVRIILVKEFIKLLNINSVIWLNY